MAGASLALRGALNGPTIASQGVGHAYAAAAMAGPWILTSICLCGVRAIEVPGVGAPDLLAFQALIVQACALSMVVSGLFQFVIGRHVSDGLYRGRTESVAPSLAAATILTVPLHAAAGAALAFAMKAPMPLALSLVALCGVFALVGNALVFVGALRGHFFVVGSFAVGAAVAWLACYALGCRWGVAGLVGGFALGQGAIAALLAARIRLEFPSDRPWDFGLLRTAARYPSLVLLGIFAAAGLWIDRAVFWFAPGAIQVRPGLRCFPMYDHAVFLAYLTALPGLIAIFLRVEVSLYERVRAFFRTIRLGGDLDAVRSGRREVHESFDVTLERVVLVQGVVALLAIVLAPGLFARMGIEWVEYHVFRVACLGTFLQMVLLANVLTALHLAMYRLALGVSAIYLGVCGLATVGTWLLGARWYGYGTVVAGLAAVAVGVPMLTRKLRRLDCDVFMSQPV